MSFRESLFKAFPSILGEAPKIAKALEKPKAVEKKEALPPLYFDAGAQLIAKRVDGRVSQDAVLSDPELGLFMTADGVGSSGKKADLASRLAVETVTAAIKQYQNLEVPLRGEEVMRLAMRDAEEAVEQFRDQHLDDVQIREINTTLTAILVAQGPDGRPQGVLGQVGDSRAYRFRLAAKNGQPELLKLSHDDNVVELLTSPDIALLTPDEARAIDQSQDGGKDVHLPPPEVFASHMDQAARSTQDGSMAEYLTGLAETLRKTQGSTGEFFWQGRAKISQALISQREGQTQHKISSFTVEDGDIVFTISDGIGDVLTEAKIQDLLVDGLAQKKTMAEIFQQIAQAARDDRSARQKNDDIGIAGAQVHVEQVRAQLPDWTGRAPEPLIEASDLQKNPTEREAERRELIAQQLLSAKRLAK